MKTYLKTINKNFIKDFIKSFAESKTRVIIKPRFTPPLIQKMLYMNTKTVILRSNFKIPRKIKKKYKQNRLSVK